MTVNSLMYDDVTAAIVCPEYDNACKRVLADKYILAWILKCCTDEFKECEIRDIAEKYIEGTPEISSVGVNPEQTNRKIHEMSNEDPSVNEGSVRYDIRFCATAPRENELIKLIVNIEAQNKYNNSYPLIKRAIYYLSRMISAQHGTEFDRSHYENIRKVYSIWICTNPPNERKSTIVKYHIAEEQLYGNVSEKLENYDLMTAVMVCLGKDVFSDNSILRLLAVLMSREMNVDTKMQLLNNDFDIPVSNDIESEVNQMCNVSAGVYEEGYVDGIAKGQLTSLRSILNKTTFTFDEAADMLSIPESERDVYRQKLGIND